MTNVTSDIITSLCYYSSKWGLPKVKSQNLAMGAMRKVTLNIYYGNRVSVVVRARESLVHGEGKQFFINIIKGKVREAL